MCRVFSESVTAQQLGSDMKGLGAVTLDWSIVSTGAVREPRIGGNRGGGAGMRWPDGVEGAAVRERSGGLEVTADGGRTTPRHCHLLLSLVHVEWQEV